MNVKPMLYVYFSMALVLASTSLAQGDGKAIGTPSEKRSTEAVDTDARQSGHQRRNIRVFEKMLLDESFVQNVGLSDQTVEKLRKSFEILREKEKDLQGKRVKVQREQLKALSETLASFPADAAKPSGDRKRSSRSSDELRGELTAIFAETENVQHELNLLTIDRILLIRDNLNDEQLEKASEAIRERFRRQREGRQGKKPTVLGAGRAEKNGMGRRAGKVEEKGKAGKVAPKAEE